MPARDEDDTMPFEPDMDTALRLTWFTAALFFLIFLVSLIGELLGWWDLIGEIGMGVGAGVSILLTLIGVLAGAGRQQVDAVGDDLRSVGQDVRSVGNAVEGNGQTLDRIEAAIVGEDGMVQELDVIQVELDEQTGVLGEQLAVLGEIRDRI